MPGKELKLGFDHEKDTKGTRRFQEVLEDGRERGAVGTLYVQKSDLESIDNPDELEVIIRPRKKA